MNVVNRRTGKVAKSNIPVRIEEDIPATDVALPDILAM
jgi:hypothetical protein